MSLDQLLRTWKRHFQTLAEAEIPVQPPTAHLAEAGSLLDAAEQVGAASSLSVALLQMGLISHLPEAFPSSETTLSPK